MYTVPLRDKHIHKIEHIIKVIKDNFQVTFVGYDQNELKILFLNSLSDIDEMTLLRIISK